MQKSVAWYATGQRTHRTRRPAGNKTTARQEANARGGENEGERAFTFGYVGAVGVGDEAGEADVDGAAETSADRRRGAKVGDALPVVELATDRDHAAPHVLAAFLAHEAGVDALEGEKSGSQILR